MQNQISELESSTMRICANSMFDNKTCYTRRARVETQKHTTHSHVIIMRCQKIRAFEHMGSSWIHILHAENQRNESLNTKQTPYTRCTRASCAHTVAGQQMCISRTCTFVHQNNFTLVSCPSIGRPFCMRTAPTEHICPRSTVRRPSAKEPAAMWYGKGPRARLRLGTASEMVFYIMGSRREVMAKKTRQDLVRMSCSFLRPF